VLSKGIGKDGAKMGKSPEKRKNPSKTEVF